MHYGVLLKNMFKPSINLSFRLIACVVLVFTIPAFIFGGWFYSRSKDFIAKSNSTSGEVIELIEINGSEGDSTYSPRVSYLDKAGRLVEATSSTSSYPPRYEKGETIEILYDPDRPQDFRTSDWFSLWGGSIICFSVGAFGLIMCLIVAFVGPLIYKGFKRG